MCFRFMLQLHTLFLRQGKEEKSLLIALLKGFQWDRLHCSHHQFPFILYNYIH